MFPCHGNKCRYFVAQACPTVVFLFLHSLDECTEIRVGNIGDDDPDCLRLVGAQPPRQSVRSVSHLRCRFQDGPFRLLVNVRLVV